MIEMGEKGPSVPKHMRRCLVWASEAFQLNLPMDDSLTMGAASEAARLSTNDPEPARCVTDSMVRSMELFAADKSQPEVARLYAGACAVLAHGCLRWSDLQRLQSLRITETALAGKSWRMKNARQKIRPWACPRKGLTESSWCADWRDLQRKAVPEDADWCLPMPTVESYDSTEPATYTDALGMLRAILVLQGMSQEEAATFSLHSFRHWLPTVANQLMVGEEDRQRIGHWAKGSGQADRYDAEACCRELAVKDSIPHAFRQGWKSVPAFEVPKQIPKSMQAARGDEELMRTVEEESEIDEDLVEDEILNDSKDGSKQMADLVYLANPKTKRVHAFLGDAVRTRCGTWQPCPEVRAQARAAVPDPSTSEVCKACFGAEMRTWAAEHGEEDYASTWSDSSGQDDSDSPDDF